MSRCKGMYSGGTTVLGYKVVDKKLEIVPEEAPDCEVYFPTVYWNPVTKADS